MFLADRPAAGSTTASGGVSCFRNCLMICWRPNQLWKTRPKVTREVPRQVKDLAVTYGPLPHRAAYAAVFVPPAVAVAAAVVSGVYLVGRRR